jgi:hypothetical protein
MELESDERLISEYGFSDHKGSSEVVDSDGLGCGSTEGCDPFTEDGGGVDDDSEWQVRTVSDAGDGAGDGE